MTISTDERGGSNGGGAVAKLPPGSRVVSRNSLCREACPAPWPAVTSEWQGPSPIVEEYRTGRGEINWRQSERS